MTTALILWATLVAGITLGGLAWERAERRRARDARRETRRTWTVTPVSEVYDWAAAEAELSDERGRPA